MGLKENIKQLESKNIKSKEMPSVPKASKQVIGVLCSCLHLSHTPPIARSVEKDWYGVMKDYLGQLEDISCKYKVPILCCGDIFDRGSTPEKVPPELINFAIRYIPNGYGFYTIPGNHDTPNHNRLELKRSPYWTLVESGVIKDLEYGNVSSLDGKSNDIVVESFPFGCELRPALQQGDGTIYLALVHHYCWIKGKSYTGASKDDRARNIIKKLKGFDAIVIGDNHKGFQYWNMFNCGTFMRRKIDEYNYRPWVGLLHSDMTVTPEYLDTSKDKFIDLDEALELVEYGIDATDFLDELGCIGKKVGNFTEAVMRFCTKHNVNTKVKQLLSKLME